MKTLKKLKNKVVKPAKDFLKRDDSKARRDSQTAGVDPPSRPRSSLGIGSSEPAPLSLQRRGSDVGTAHHLENPPPARLPSIDPTATLSATGGDPSGISPILGDGPSAPVDPVAILPMQGGGTPEISPTSGLRISVADVDERKPVKLSSYIVDPTAAYRSKSDWGSTLYTTAGVVIDVVKESSDVFTPLKSVVGGLSAVLKYYDQAMANRKTIESLIPRIEGLAESLGSPVPEGETKEMKRREVLKQQLDKSFQDLKQLEDRGKVEGFLKGIKDAEALTGLAEDIRDAMMDYQTALQQEIFIKNHQLVDAADRTLLNGIHHTPDAGYRSGNRQGCLKGTRKDVLLQIEQWLMDETDRRIFWLNGLAGTGKTTIAQTFAEISFADGKLGASFFCSRDFEARSNLQAIFPTLAFQLAYRYPKFREQLLEVLKANPDVGRESLCSQLEQIIVHPLEATQIPTLIIIDALDECKDAEPASALLSVLSRYVHKIPSVKFFITGRPEPPIRNGFRLESLRPITDVLKLHEVDRSSVDEDIRLYLRTQLTVIRKMQINCEFPGEWPSSFDINILCKKAAGLFIYAATAAKFVAPEFDLPTERLSLIIKSQSADHEGGIDSLCTQVLRLAFRNIGPDQEKVFARFRTVVGAVLLVFHPLSGKTLSDLVKSCGTWSHILVTLGSLHSLIQVPESGDDLIRVFHKSFPDFLTNKTRCKDLRFLVDPAAYNEGILFSCLDLMKERLKKNICNLDDYALLSEIKDLSARREKYIGGSLEYACQYWARHLAGIPGNGPHVEQIQETINQFFQLHLLCWIEVLSIIGRLEVTLHAINWIRQWYTSVGVLTYKQADDSEHLILEHFNAIHDSPSHVYHSALPLSPSSSWLHQCYKAEILQEARVVMRLPDQWDMCSRIISIDYPYSLAYWGVMIAVGLDSGDIALFDVITGRRKSVLSSHTDPVWSLSFSPDGSLLASGGEDNTVKLWDIQTGGLVRTFSGHLRSIRATSISSDCTTIASGAWDGTVHLWNIRAGNCHTVEGHGDPVTTISFSPINSQHFVSSLSSQSDCTVQQWNTDGCKVGEASHEADEVGCIAYTSDGAHFVSCGGTVATVRNSESGKMVVKLNAPTDEFHCCCFSPDGRFVACAAGEMIYVWSITKSEAHLIGNLVGHSSTIIFLAFSSPSSLISGSEDNTVRTWQSVSFLLNPVISGNIPTSVAPAPIKSVSVFEKDDIVIISDSAGMVRTWDLKTGICKSSFSTPIKGIQDVHLAGDTLIGVVSQDPEVDGDYNIWDVGKGQLLRAIPIRLGDGLRISGDGFRIFGTHYNMIQCVSVETGEHLHTIDCFEEYGTEAGLVVHGTKVWIEGTNEMGWDFGGKEVTTFSLFKEFPGRLFLGYSNKSKTGIKPPWVQDTVTGRLAFHLPERYLGPSTKKRLHGQYLVMGSPPGEVVIIDFGSVCH